MKKLVIFLFSLFLITSCDINTKKELCKLTVSKGIAITSPRMLNLEEIEKGTQIKALVLIPKGKELNSLKINGVETPLADDRTIKLTVDKDMSIIVTLKPVTLSLTLSNPALSVIYPKNIVLNKIDWGTNITVKVDLGSEKALESFTVNGSHRLNYVKKYEYKFKIEEDTEINASLCNGYKLELGEHLSVLEPENLDVDRIKEGTKVILKVDNFEDKAVESFTINTEEKSDLDYKYKKIDGKYEIFAQRVIKNIDKNYNISVNFYEDTKVLPAQYYDIDSFTLKVFILEDAKNSSFSDILIPNCVELLKQSTFINNNTLTSVIISENISDIENGVFQNCSQLTSVTLKDGITYLGGSMFNNCVNLTEITIPKSVKAINNNAFRGCINLTTVNIQGNLDSIYYAAFANCGKLNSITFPENIKMIGKEAFENCIALESIEIPDSVTSIKDSAFINCSELTSATIPASLETIGKNIFSGCENLTTVTLESGLKKIGESMFSDCTSLTNITLPESITTIEQNAFRGCSKLSSITIPIGVKTMRSNVFKDCSNLEHIYCEASSKPSNWSENWNGSDVVPTWGYEG